MIEKMYINDDGKILKIKLQGLADYAFAYLCFKNHEFLSNWKISIVERIQFKSLNFANVLRYFEKNKYHNALDFTVFKSEYAEREQIKRLFSVMNNFSPKEKLRYWRFLIDHYLKDIIEPYIFDPVSYKKILLKFRDSFTK